MPIPDSFSALQLAHLLTAQMQHNLMAGATLTNGFHPHSLLNLNAHSFGLSLPQNATLMQQQQQQQFFPPLPHSVVMPRGLPMTMNTPANVPGGTASVPSSAPPGGGGSLEAAMSNHPMANMSAQGLQQALAHQLAISQQLQQLQQMQLLALAANIAQQQQQQQQQLPAASLPKTFQPQSVPSLPLPHQKQQHPPLPPPSLPSMSLPMPMSPTPPCKQPPYTLLLSLMWLRTRLYGGP